MDKSVLTTNILPVCAAPFLRALCIWIRCYFQKDFDDGLLCFVNPSKPQLRRWFRRISTEETVERLASALEDILSEHPKVHD